MVCPRRDMNSPSTETRPFKPWVLPLGGALLVVGLTAGYLAGARGSATSSLGQPEARSPKQEASRPALSPSAREPDSALRPPETTANPASAEPPPEGERLTAKEARDREVARVVASGADPRNLTVDALRVGESWARATRKEGVELKFAQWSCYRAGCMTTVSHAPELLQPLTRAISTDQAFVGWGGEKFRSGPIEQAGGKIEVTWILYAPPAGEPALVMAQDPGTPVPAASAN
jgi:hypothetical protein